MCFRIFGKRLPFSAPLMGPSNTVTSLTENLQHIFTDEAQVKKYFLCDDGSYNVNKDRLISILNKIADTEAGRNILKALKTEQDKIPENRRRKIALQLNDENSEKDKYLKNCGCDLGKMTKDIKEDTLKKLNYVDFGIENFYAFDSARAIQYSQEPLIININKNLISAERYIFDQNEITTHKFPANEKSEAYLIAHELTHVVSFLNFFAENPRGDWDKRKNADVGWVNFFNETEQMKAIYHGLLLDGFTPKQIIDTFRTFFLNTEEARNVLGLVKGTVDGQETLIGEFHLFTKREVCSIVLYPNTELDQKIRDQLSPQQTTVILENLKLGPIHRAILNRVTNKLNDMYLPKIKQDSIDAKDALGSQFAGFNLVNVPRENSAIEAIKKVIPNTGNRNFFNIQNSIEEVTDNYVFQQLMFSTSSLPRDMIKQQAEIDHLQDMASLADRDIVLIRSDDKNPQNYTFKFFDANGFNTYLQDKNIKSIFEKNPNAVFIYYNGVNHFQALVPQQPAQ